MLNDNIRLKLSLLLLRYGVAVVFLMWTVDKMIRPEHAAEVFAHFYQIKNLVSTVMNSIGIAELLLIAAFVIGWKRKFSYGAVMILHAISTLSSYRQLLAPFTGTNLLFFASLPMLAATVSLFILRDEDTLLSLRRR